MSDIFREVDEEYRQELLLRKLHANAVPIIIVLVLTIAGVGGNAWWRQHRRAEDEAQTFVLYKALEDAHNDDTHHVDPAQSRDIMVKAAETLSGSRRVSAQLTAARYSADAGDGAGALSFYDAIIAEAGVSATNRAIARLAAADLRVDTADPAKLSAELDDLAAPASPWRFSARELQGALAMRQGDFAKSKDIFRALSNDAETPPGLRQRAASLATITSIPGAAAPGAAAPGAPAPSAPAAGKMP